VTCMQAGLHFKLFRAQRCGFFRRRFNFETITVIFDDLRAIQLAKAFLPQGRSWNLLSSRTERVYTRTCIGRRKPEFSPRGETSHSAATSRKARAEGYGIAEAGAGMRP